MDCSAKMYEVKKSLIKLGREIHDALSESYSQALKTTLDDVQKAVESVDRLEDLLICLEQEGLLKDEDSKGEFD